MSLTNWYKYIQVNTCLKSWTKHHATDALLSALAKEQQTHSTKTNKQKTWLRVSLVNAPIGPSECSWARLLTESERKRNKAKENDLINDMNDETDDGQLG